MRKVGAGVVLVLLAPSIPICAQSKPPVLPPRLISLPVPDCRAGKPCHHNHGEVRLIVDVLENGKAGDIRAEIGDGILVETATEMAQQAEFVPGSFFGKPTVMNYVLTIKF